MLSVSVYVFVPNRRAVNLMNFGTFFLMWAFDLVTIGDAGNETK